MVFTSRFFNRAELIVSGEPDNWQSIKRIFGGLSVINFAKDYPILTLEMIGKIVVLTKIDFPSGFSGSGFPATSISRPSLKIKRNEFLIPLFSKATGR